MTPKKGTLSDYNSLREITQMSVLSKIKAKIIIRRMTGAVDEVLRMERLGFKKHRGCTDQICALRNIQSRTWHRVAETTVRKLVDFENAFNSVRHYRLNTDVLASWCCACCDFIKIFKNLKYLDTYSVKRTKHPSLNCFEYACHPYICGQFIPLFLSVHKNQSSDGS